MLALKMYNHNDNPKLTTTVIPTLQSLFEAESDSEAVPSVVLCSSSSTSAPSSSSSCDSTSPDDHSQFRSCNWTSMDAIEQPVSISTLSPLSNISCSPCSVSLSGRLNVTRAASECSIDTDIDEDYDAECCHSHGFMLVGKEKTDVELRRNNVTVQASSLNGNMYTDDKTKLGFNKAGFAIEALRRLHDKPSSATPQQEQDSTDALQERLQSLLVSTSSQEPAEKDELQHRTHEALPQNSMYYNKNPSPVRIDDNERLIQETAELKKKLDVMSMEIFEAKQIRDFKTESNGFLGPSSHQTLAEEMYCKSMIRQIVAQVREETKHWSEMQELVYSLKEEMQLLIEARSMWESRALQAEAQLLSLKEVVDEWRSRAKNAEEEVSMLRTERQVLRNKIYKMKQRTSVSVSASALDYDANKKKKLGAMIVPSSIVIPNPEARAKLDEMPRHASVGTQEDYALCESFVHSRNESGRSSIDLGSSQRINLNKTIKKSLDFSINNATKSQRLGPDTKPQSSRLESDRKHDAAKLKQGGQFFMKPDRIGCISLSNADQSTLNCVSNAYRIGLVSASNANKVGSISASNANKAGPISVPNVEQKDKRKTSRVYLQKENVRPSVSHAARSIFVAQNQYQEGFLCQVVGTGHHYDQQLTPPSKSKSSIPAAPASTPLRLPFSEIINMPSTPM